MLFQILPVPRCHESDQPLALLVDQLVDIVLRIITKLVIQNT